VVGHQHRQPGYQGADLQHAVTGAHLGGQAQLAVFALGTARCLAVTLQQAATTAFGAGIELEPEQADGVHPNAQGALGKAGLVAQHKALGPFLGLGLRGLVLAKVAVEVEVAQFHAGLAVIDKGRVGRAANAGECCRGQQAKAEWWESAVH
uniref:Secreted protein n=1 Tax=Steinernema glaseri TaxID=37863 RepID=A0A1I8ALT3_9BILA